MMTWDLGTPKERGMNFSPTVISIETAIAGFNLEEMNAVDSLLEARRVRIQHEAVTAFQVGMVVEFTGLGGRIVTGEITKVNRKTVVVEDNNFRFQKYRECHHLF